VSRAPAAKTPGFFHKILGWFKWKEPYFGQFFVQNQYFRDWSKITDYGVGQIFVDRFLVEFAFYLIFALLGFILGGPKVVKKEPSKDLKKTAPTQAEIEPDSDEENKKKKDEDAKKDGKDTKKKPPKAPKPAEDKKKDPPKNADIPSVTQAGIGSFFSCARFLTGYSMGMNILFSGILEILNHAWRMEYNVPFLSISFGIACMAIVFILIEFVYLFMVSLAGEAPKEIDDMASLKSGQNSATRNNTRAPSKTNSDDGDGVVSVAKRGKVADKIGFFLRGSLIFNNLTK
jgi:hypothetical protein